MDADLANKILDLAADALAFADCAGSIADRDKLNLIAARLIAVVDRTSIAAARGTNKF